MLDAISFETQTRGENAVKNSLVFLLLLACQRQEPVTLPGDISGPPAELVIVCVEPVSVACFCADNLVPAAEVLPEPADLLIEAALVEYPVSCSSCHVVIAEDPWAEITDALLLAEDLVPDEFQQIPVEPHNACADSL